MKLFGLFVAAASANEDRIFSDNPNFINGEVGAWWTAYQDVPDNNAANIRVQTKLYFDTFVADPTSQQSRVAGIMKNHLLRQMDMNQEAAKKCGGRRRSKRSNERSWNLNTSSNKAAMDDMFWQYAHWTRNELQADCPKQAQRLLKRLDRLRLIWFWQTCTKDIDPEGAHCSWAVTEDNPRNDNNFGRDDNTPFVVVGCQGAKADLSCPYGGTITIEEAHYGRKNASECKKNAVGSTKRCWGKNAEDITGEADFSCTGRDNCNFGYSNDDICPDVDTYVRVKYTCQSNDQ